MNQRILATFRGPVDCLHSAGAVNLVLRGKERDSGVPLELLFSGASLARTGNSLRDIEVLELIDERAHHFWQIRTPDANFEILARAVQIHRGAARAFAHAVPPPRVPLQVRWGWTALLWALRVPGAAGLAMRWRARG
jgi:hypothetical protein